METMIVKDADFLRNISTPVETVAEAKKTFEFLKATLMMYDGYGLSAIQLGIPKRIAAIKNNRGEFFPLINPEVIEEEDEFVFEGEGCLSFPGVFVNSKRYAQFTIKNMVIDGDVFRPETQVFYYETDKTRRTSSDLECIVLQHEIDHFSGLTILDYGANRYEITRRNVNKTGRNEPCPCGKKENSGKPLKYKKCCGK